MYSAVLMLALTAGSETADFGRNRCTGCSATRCTTTAVAAAPSCSKAAACSRPRLFGNLCAASHGCATTVRAHCSTSHGCASSCHGGLFARLRARCSCAATTSCSSTKAPEKKKDMKEPEKVKEPKKTSLPAPATIIVRLPAGARLTVDGAATTSVSEERILVTPELESGLTYTYTMQAEIVRDGRTVAQTQEVNVRGGETTTVQFQFPNQGVASR